LITQAYATIVKLSFLSMKRGRIDRDTIV